MVEKKIQIHGVPETMLQTLYARAKETQSRRGFFRDDKAVEIVSALDYDFSKAEKDKTMRNGVIARSILLDKMTKVFLQQHSGTTVINLACGLDSRCYRVSGKYRQWYNLDLPETMKIRKQFFRQSEHIFQITGSAMDAEWTESVRKPDGPVLVIIEGLTMYLHQSDIQQIFSVLGTHFPGAVIFVEVMNPWVVSHVKEKSIEGSTAKFTWGIKDGQSLQKLLPGFRFLEERSLTEGMYMPVYRVLEKIPFIRNISNKILVMQG